MNLDHGARMTLAAEALDGLSVGDAIGEALSYQHHRARELDDFSALGQGRLRFTDDTAMPLGIVECLSRLQTIDQDALAKIFAGHFRTDPERGYGKMSRTILTQISDGASWRPIFASASGRGSFGNGSAMRVGPLGAYFSDDYDTVREMAAASAYVTHSHPEGIAGAIAVAVATAAATRSATPEGAASRIWQSVLDLTQEGATAQGLALARRSGPNLTHREVAKSVGCGYNASCQDTVPFAIWNACRCLHNFQEALLCTIEVGGDCDTNAAVVGGIVAGYGTSACIPADWRIARESLPVKFPPRSHVAR